MFIKKKNLLEGEDLLLIPNLHWMYALRHTLRFMLLVLVLLVAWAAASYYSAWDVLYLVGEYSGSLILAAALVALLSLAWDIFSYITTEYGITNKRLVIKKGVFRIATAEIPTDRIESIYCFQSIFGRIFRFGNIYVSGISGKMPVFFMVSRPFTVRRKIVEVIEKNKAISVVHGNLPKAKSEPIREIEVEPVNRFGTIVRMLPENQS